MDSLVLFVNVLYVSFVICFVKTFETREEEKGCAIECDAIATVFGTIYVFVTHVHDHKLKLNNMKKWSPNGFKQRLCKSFSLYLLLLVVWNTVLCAAGREYKHKWYLLWLLMLFITRALLFHKRFDLFAHTTKYIILYRKSNILLRHYIFFFSMKRKINGMFY